MRAAVSTLVSMAMFGNAFGNRVARAQASSAAPSITRNDYSLELNQGPLIAPGRITGLAGATTADAEAVEGVYNNAAAPAVREPFSLRWFDYDISVGLAFPGAYGNTDFDNRGENGDQRLIQRTSRFLYYNLGLQLQFGELGITVLGDFLSYNVGSLSGSTSSLSLTTGRIHAVGAYSLLDNQVVIGAGARIVVVNIAAQTSGGDVIQMAGAAPEIGVIVKPNDSQWRVGATARAPVEATNILTSHATVDPETGLRRAGGFILPDRVIQPWEIEAGIAWQYGPRPLNPPWIDPEKDELALRRRIARQRADRAAFEQADLASLPNTTAEDVAKRAALTAAFARDEQTARAAEDKELAEAHQRLYQERKARNLNWPRERVLLLASVLITGASKSAVALEGFIDQRRDFVGQSVTLAPRFAFESEPLANLLRLRAGVYFEPSRFSDGTYRQHFTFGGDVRLVSWDIFGILAPTTWRLTSFLDLAPRYQNFGFGIGAWH